MLGIYDRETVRSHFLLIHFFIHLLSHSSLGPRAEVYQALHSKVPCRVGETDKTITKQKKFRTANMVGGM